MKTRILFIVSALSSTMLLSCTQAVKRELETEVQEQTIPAKPGVINKIPATLKCSKGEEFQLSVNGTL